MNTKKNTSTTNTKNTKNTNKQERACLNCTRTHHKCDKKLPGCTNCLRKKIPCELNNIVKKRGRPFNTTKQELQDRKVNVNKKRTIDQVQPSKICKKFKTEEFIFANDQSPSESSPINQSFSYESPIHSNEASPINNSVKQQNDDIPTISYYNSFFSMDPINIYCSQNTENSSSSSSNNNDLIFDFGLKIENPFHEDLSFHLSNPLDVGELDLERFNYFLVNPGEDTIF